LLSFLVFELLVLGAVEAVRFAVDFEAVDSIGDAFLVFFVEPEASSLLSFLVFEPVELLALLLLLIMITVSYIHNKYLNHNYLIHS
jgi:hypothetical protein